MSAWQVSKAADGRSFYYNPSTNQSSWEKPDQLKDASERAIDTTDWKQYESNGRKYFVNKLTNETTWDIPDEVSTALANAQNRSTAPSTPNLSSTTPTLVNSALSSTGAGQLIGYTGANNSYGPPVAHGPEPVLWFNNDKEAYKAFAGMLRDHGVNASWTWERVLKETITAPMFKALRTSDERRAGFEQYLGELKQRDVERKQASLERIRPAWREALGRASEGDHGMKSWWSWPRVRNILQREHEDVWRMSRDDDERKVLWQEYVSEMRRKENKREDEMRQVNLDKLAKLFDKFEIGIEISWHSTRKMIERSKEWQNDDDLRQLDPSDFLQFYQDRVQVQEREAEQIRQKRIEEKRHGVRKNRQGFVQLLQELVEQGKIHTAQDWADIYPLVKNEQRFQNILGNPGSSPLELFWDVVDQIDEKVEENGRVVEVALAEKKMPVKLDTTWDEYCQAIANSDVAKRIQHMSEQDRRNVFDMIHGRYVRLANAEKQRLEKKLRGQIDDLRYAIRRIEPEIDLEAAYDDVVPRIQDLPEYKALPDDESRKQAYERYAQRMKERKQARDDEAARQKAEEATRAEKEAELAALDKERRERRRKRQEESGSEASPRRVPTSSKRETSRSVSRVPDGDDIEMEDVSRRDGKRSGSVRSGRDSERHSKRRDRDEDDDKRRSDRSKRHRDDADYDRHRSNRSRHDDKDRERSLDRSRDRRRDSRRHESSRSKRMDIDGDDDSKRGGSKQEDGEIEEGEVE